MSPDGKNFRGTHRTVFREVWNKMHRAKGYGWEVNPWVWVIEFKKLEADNDG